MKTKTIFWRFTYAIVWVFQAFRLYCSGFLKRPLTIPETIALLFILWIVFWIGVSLGSGIVDFFGYRPY